MSDDVDRANENAAIVLAVQLLARKPAGLIPCGACHFCSEDVPGDKLFCGVDCRDDHQKVEAAKGRNGKF